MSSQTLVYLYNQRQLVVLLQAGASGQRRYEQVYAKTLTISRGVDNLLEFAFVNQEQKPVNIKDKQLTCRILNYQGNQILLQKTLTPVFPITGITSLQLTKAEIENIPAQYCYYSIEIPVGTFDYPVFVDADGGARGKINIVNSVLPSFVAANETTIPSHLQPLEQMPLTYHSSYIYTKQSPVLTTQTYFEHFTGTVVWQGSTQPDFAYFYDIGSVTPYDDFTGVVGYNIQGYHPYVRLQIVNSGTPPANRDGRLSGDVVKIYWR